MAYTYWRNLYVLAEVLMTKRKKVRFNASSVGSTEPFTIHITPKQRRYLQNVSISSDMPISKVIRKLIDSDMEGARQHAGL